MNTQTSKVQRDGGPGYYKFIGTNFVTEFNSVECETKWWEVNLYAEEDDHLILDVFSDHNHFELKREAVGTLKALDKFISESKDIIEENDEYQIFKIQSDDRAWDLKDNAYKLNKTTMTNTAICGGRHCQRGGWALRDLRE